MKLVSNKCTDRAWRLHPRLAIHLHGEALPSADDDIGTLGQSPSRGSQTGFYLTHVQTVFKPYDFNQSIANVCGMPFNYSRYIAESNEKIKVKHALASHGEIDEIEAAAGQFAFLTIVLLA